MGTACLHSPWCQPGWLKGWRRNHLKAHLPTSGGRRCWRPQGRPLEYGHVVSPLRPSFLHTGWLGSEGEYPKGENGAETHHFDDPASEVTQHYFCSLHLFCYILFIRSKSQRLAHRQRERNSALPLDDKWQKKKLRARLKTHHTPPSGLSYLCFSHGRNRDTLSRAFLPQIFVYLEK